MWQTGIVWFICWQGNGLRESLGRIEPNSSTSGTLVFWSPFHCFWLSSAATLHLATSVERAKFRGAPGTFAFACHLGIHTIALGLCLQSHLSLPGNHHLKLLSRKSLPPWPTFIYLETLFISEVLSGPFHALPHQKDGSQGQSAPLCVRKIWFLVPWVQRCF